MKTVVAASAGLFALLVAGAVGAAELPRKAAKPVLKAEPAPVAFPNWTGFYVGGNIGSSVGRHESNVTALSGGNAGVPAGTPLYDGPRAFMLAPDGWNGGVQAGYNWQVTPQWLVGIEADIQISSAKDRMPCVLPCGAPMAFVPGGIGPFFPVTLSENSVESRLDWFGTLRGRLAYVAGPVLFYATGGLAYGEVTTKSNVAGSTRFVLLTDPINTFSGSFEGSDVKTGWAAGWGIEAQLGGNWSVKKEYLYLDLGTVSNTFNTFFNTANPLFLPDPGDLAATRTVSSDIRHHVFRTGLNYKFGGPAAPIAAYNWTGFYIGANGGYSVGTHETEVVAISGPGASGLVPVGTVLYGGPRDFMLAPDGWNGGGQIGYNWHVMPQWVIGVEADLQASNASDRVSCFLPCNLPIAITTDPNSAFFPVTFSEVLAESKLDWFGTLRARVGRASGPAFFYFTGGLAYGEVSSRGRVAGTSEFVLGGQETTFAGSFDSRTTKLGWAIGSGIEAQLAGNWSLKSEYLLVDLGKVDNTFSTIVLTSTAGATPGDVAATRTVTTDIREHIFRAGLNYRFGDFGKGPVITRY